MTLEIRGAQRPHVSALDPIPREFVNPRTGLADYWLVSDYEDAKAIEPFVAPQLRQGSTIDVRESIASGAYMLPTSWPNKGGEAVEPVVEPATEPIAQGTTPVEDPVPDMDAMTVAELKNLARDAGVTGFSAMTKTELLATLREE